jgi:splicing factor 3B subunit 3
LCERFTLLPNDKKQMIAGELDRSVREIERKISVSNLLAPKMPDVDGLC